jgi:hypothetical protein
MSELKVTDRRWWARGEESPAAAEEPRLKPAYVEELEQKIAVKDLEIQQLVARYKSAADEFEQARARLRKEVTKDVERGRRSLIAGFLDVLDNLDRALDSAGDRAATRSSTASPWCASSFCRRSTGWASVRSLRSASHSIRQARGGHERRRQRQLPGRHDRRCHSDGVRHRR